MSETVEKVLMNKKTGQLGIGIAITFHEKYHQESSRSLNDYTIAFILSEPDGWIVSGNGFNDRVAWVFVNTESVNKYLEVLGEL